MVESKSKSFHKQRPAKARVPVIYRQPVNLETEVPERPRPEDLLSAPDESGFGIQMRDLSRRINRIKKKLADKSRVEDEPVLSLEELLKKRTQLQDAQNELHKQRTIMEGKLKNLTKSIKTVLF